MSGAPEESAGPSVDSKKKEDRITARRGRITKRNRNAKNDSGSVDKAKEESVEDKDTAKSRKQIDISNNLSYCRLLVRYLLFN